MTTEVAIINREAIALAADSAVTVSMPESKKIYNSANKLFSLSRKHPVGVMIYGNANLVGVPWESLIKIYRKSSENKSFSKLKDYGEDFINFLNSNQKYFLGEDIEIYPAVVISQKLKTIKKDIEKEVSILTSPVQKMAERKIINDVIERHLLKAKSFKVLPQYENLPIINYINSNREYFKEVIDQEFERKFSKKNIEKLILISVYSMISEVFSDLHSGVVIAGFGEDEAIPDLVSYDIECFFEGTLKYNINLSRTYTKRPEPDIIGFAQDDMIQAFMTGISPELEYMSSFALKNTLKNFFDSIAESFAKSNTDKKQVEQFRETFKNHPDVLWGKYKDSLDKLKRKLYSKPIYDTISVLPKGELAEMAEALVSLTALKRRTSADDESVGIPVDVALISKGDGFVWIKRKHYFDPSLNRDFFRRD